METVIARLIIFGIPAIFLLLCIVNILKIIKLKKNKIAIKKSLFIKSIIFGMIFIFIVSFYIWVIYSLSKEVPYM